MASIWSQQIHKMTDDLQTALDKITNVNDEDGYAFPPLKVIYIAGKYRDNRGEWFVQDHIREAEKAALFVWQHGAVAICPHKNTSFVVDFICKETQYGQS